MRSTIEGTGNRISVNENVDYELLTTTGDYKCDVEPWVLVLARRSPRTARRGDELKQIPAPERRQTMHRRGFLITGMGAALAMSTKTIAAEDSIKNANLGLLLYSFGLKA